MKKLLLLLLLTPAITFLKAQSRTETPKDEVIKEWAFLGESKTQLDISYRVVMCAGTGQIHLQIFNENPKAQVARFDIEITNADGSKFRKEISFSVEKAAIVQPACNGETNLNDLKISVPSDYDINNLKVKISFKYL
jgi:hypothetical protein